MVYTLGTKCQGSRTPDKIRTVGDRTKAHRGKRNEHTSGATCMSKCLGLRKNKELKTLHGKDFYEKDGELRCHIKSGKGRKAREEKFYGTIEELNTCKHLIAIAGDGPLFPTIPNNLDVHYYRAVYASRVYHAHARDLDSIPHEDCYFCRGEKEGDVYDCKA